MQHGQLVERLRQNFFSTFAPLLDVGKRYALSDYPDSFNSGDHAIWLGEKALLAALGIVPVYQCSVQTYAPATMAAALGQGAILLHGGGNFGDIYGLYHEFRLQVLRDFPHNDVVIFPQTAMFFSDTKLAQSVEAFAAHGKVTIAARDALSFHVLTRHFGNAARIVYASDAAFMLGVQPRQGSANFDVMWLNRTDREGVYSSVIAEATGLRDLRDSEANLGVFDDGIETNSVVAVSGANLLVSDWYCLKIAGGESARKFQALDFDQRSRFWVSRAMRLLSAGRVVVTDRLHAHILCTLMGIPHVLLNNNYGKNFSFYESWSRPLDICLLASSAADAWEKAHVLLAQSGARPQAVAPKAGPQPSDAVHWANPNNLHDAWSYRSERAASYVPGGATVLDVGCGKMMIEKMLPENCRYIPSDLVSRDERTIVCDLNSGEYPPQEGVTHITVLGVMEYLTDPQAFWRWLAASKARIIFSYVTYDPAFPPPARRGMGWVNDFVSEGIVELAAGVGYELIAQEQIPPDTQLFVFDPSQ